MCLPVTKRFYLSWIIFGCSISFNLGIYGHMMIVFVCCMRFRPYCRLFGIHVLLQSHLNQQLRANSAVSCDRGTPMAMAPPSSRAAAQPRGSSPMRSKRARRRGRPPSVGSLYTIPIHSMNAIYAYIDPPNHPNVANVPYMESHGASGQYDCGLFCSRFL